MILSKDSIPHVTRNDPHHSSEFLYSIPLPPPTLDFSSTTCSCSFSSRRWICISCRLRSLICWQASGSGGRILHHSMPPNVQCTCCTLTRAEDFFSAIFTSCSLSSSERHSSSTLAVNSSHRLCEATSSAFTPCKNQVDQRGAADSFHHSRQNSRG